MVFHLRLVMSFKTKKGKHRLKGLSKGLIQGKSIWLEAYKNKIALFLVDQQLILIQQGWDNSHMSSMILFTSAIDEDIIKKYEGKLP